MRNRQENLPYRIESDSKTYERQKRNNRTVAGLVAAALLGVTLAGTSACSAIAADRALNNAKQNKKIETKARPSTPIEKEMKAASKWGEVDTTINGLAIKPGARIRKDPLVPNKYDVDNIMVVYNDDNSPTFNVNRDSCDETAAAVVEDGRTLLSNVINSQIDIHKVYGGVVPEVAARSHIEVINPVIDQAMTNANLTWGDIDAIAVTYAPGLIGSLLIGTLAARTLAILKNKPLYPIHHVESHVYANFFK